MLEGIKKVANQVKVKFLHYKRIITLLSILFLVLLVAVIAVLRTNPRLITGILQQGSRGPTSSLAPRLIRPLPSGTQYYSFSSTNVPGPVPSEVTIDPLTPAVGATQTVLVKVKYSSPITSAGIILHTDNKTTEFPLTLIDGTNSNGTWKGTWSMPDSYNYTYYLQFDIRSANGNYQQGLMFR